ncbi:hypothetical protein [Maribellus sediminis]|uniref:hypothetical protein n=1 Tax=Maribellus sediminis TaxID=2696285 RepID=UPI001430B48C|nr:hypothetical protein [Maribellus sediminis]
MRTILNGLLILTILSAGFGRATAQQSPRWNLNDNGGIVWKVEANDSHMDHIEMSGFYVSSIVHYGVTNGSLTQKVHLVFPMLRTIPNDTHASLAHEIDYKNLGQIKINGQGIEEKPDHFYIDGLLGYHSKTPGGIEIKHVLFPSTDDAVFLDKIEISNSGAQAVSVEIPKVEYSHITDADKGVYGAYKISVRSTKSGQFQLKPNESLNYALVYTGRKAGFEEIYISPEYELNKREKLIKETFADLHFESPDKVLNQTFAFAKLRAVESIFHTKGGLLHAPGGGRYYAAIWANDQAEYANPFFPFLGNLAGNESAMNSFRHFARYINDDFKPIPSSIIAEGTDYWNGAGDRGDMAMIAYGAGRFALACGNKTDAKELWPLIEWCLEYSRRKINSDGVVSSDSDELEGRFPAGKANLNTSSLYYDALKSAVLLGKELNIDEDQLNEYANQAERLEVAIENYFGSKLDGFETYRYYKENDVLRAWICTPLTVDIFNRSEGTIDALFSDKLWTDDGLASASGSTTFWDRATLYALRGVFAAGETKKAMPFLSYYSKRRLLGEHVPYPVEAYPEGNQRHLSAESALYCRIITEGVFGIRPTGFSEFKLTPQLPEDWNSMALKNIKAFNQDFNIEVIRKGSKLAVKVSNSEKVFIESLIENGESISVKL